MQEAMYCFYCPSISAILGLSGNMLLSSRIHINLYNNIQTCTIVNVANVYMYY